jgi:hypothetical protein
MGVAVRVVHHVQDQHDKRAWTHIKVPIAFAEQMMDELARYPAISSIEVRRSSGSVMVRHQYSLDELLDRLKRTGCDPRTVDSEAHQT